MIPYQNLITFKLVVRVQQQHRRFLGAPYSICIDDNDHEYRKKNRTYRSLLLKKLNRADFYILSRQSCREECVALNVMKQCMCKLVWWNSTFDHLMAQEKFKICTIEEHVKCLNNIHDHQVKCNCPVACEDIRKRRKNK